MALDADKLNRWLTLGANLGVIAGIIFLGYELRQNNQLLVEEARLSMLENQKEWAYFVAAADNVSNAVISPDGGSMLSETDKIRRAELIGTLLFMWQWEFELSQSNLFGITELPVAANRYGWEAYRIGGVWPDIRNWYSDKFARFMDEQVATE